LSQWFFFALFAPLLPFLGRLKDCQNSKKISHHIISVDNKENPEEKTEENAAILSLPAPRFRPICLLCLPDSGLRFPNGHSASGHCSVNNSQKNFESDLVKLLARERREG
jgi:hypothetical protein